MKSFILSLFVTVVYIVQPAQADTLWSCSPDKNNPSDRTLFLSASDNKLSIFDANGEEVLIAPFDNFRETRENGLIIRARFHLTDSIVYSFSIATNEANTRGLVMFGITAQDETYFWNCK